MSKKPLFRISSLSLITALMMSPKAEAQIPITAFKHITRYFLPGQTFNSPTYGAAALLSGLVYDLRFYGNIESKKDHVKDKGMDDLAKLVINLFPSSGGALTVETTTADSFGKYVTPASVAQLLNFAHDVRKDKPLTAKQISTYNQIIQKTLDEKLFGPLKDKKNLQTKINGILNSIINSIANETKGLYPQHTTEQVINAFFCEKFNTQKDIWNLLKDLDPEIVDSGKVKLIDPEKVDILQEEDLETIAQKIDQKENYDVDDLFALLNADVFFLKTPYKPGNLISNGNTRPFVRLLNGYDFGALLFPDCGEMAARHVMNLVLYNPETKQFDLSHVRKHIKEDNPYFKFFEAFYQTQTPGQANDGNISMRSLWAGVLGDLNVGGGAMPISYLKKRTVQSDKGEKYDYEYELNPGYANFIKVFYKIFGLEFKKLPTTGGLATKTLWLEESLEKLFKIINPTQDYEFDLSTLREDGDDLSGNIQITVKGEETFSFKYYTEVGRHSEVKDLLVPPSAEEVDYSLILKAHLEAMTQEEDTAEEALWLLKPGLGKNFQLFYYLFSERLSDNGSRIRVLKKVNQYYKAIVADPTLTKMLPRILKNILADIAWEDPAVLIEAFPVVSKLMEIEELSRSNIFSLIKGFYVSQENDLKTPHLQVLVPQITTLIGDETIEDIEGLAACKALKHLDLSDSKIKTLPELGTLTNLQTLNLSNTKFLQELSVENLSQLKRLNLENSGIEILSGLNTLANLERLNLSGTDLSELSVENLNQLKYLNLDNSLIETITALNTLTKLEELRFKDSQLYELSVENLTQLKKLDLENSSIEILSELNTLKNLEWLNLGGIRLPVLSVENLSQLKYLNLDNSSIETITGLDTLTKLEELHLKGTKIHELSVENCNQLWYVDLSDSAIETLPGLNTLTKLEELYLKGTKIHELSVEKFNQLEILDLDESAIETITGLNALEKLGVLLLGGTKLKELSVENLIQLEILNLNNSAIEEIKGLNTLDNLQALDLGGTRLRQLSLENLRQLEHLNLTNSGIETLPGLDTLDNLQILELGGTKLRQLPVGNLRQLERLDLTNSAIEALTGLNNLENLQALDLSGTMLKDFSLENLGQLKTLNLANTNIDTAPKGLNTLTNLETLNLSDTSLLESLSVDNLLQLTNLNLEQSSIQKLEWLHNLPKLETLNLSDTYLLESLSVEKLPQLKTLNLRNSEVETVDELNTLLHLQTLDLSYTKLKDFSLENLSQLKNLSLNGTNIDIAPNGFNTLTKLEMLDLSDTQSFEQLSLQNLNRLQKLELESSALTSLRIDNLPNLKTLSLKGTQSLTSLDIATDMKDLTIDLRESSLTKANIVGLEHLDDTKILW